MKLISGNTALRPLRQTDASRLAELANNEKISCNLRDGFPNPYTLADAEKFLATFTNQYPVTFFGIEYNNEYVGNISLVPCADVHRMSAEIGYFIGEPYWNKGIVTRAVNLITDYGFNTLGIARIQTGVFEYNLASQRVLEKCGFMMEGIFRKSVLKQGKLWDEVRFALLKPGL
ncbi:MAG: GNAT family protein [Bacteroidales bacterium]